MKTPAVLAEYARIAEPRLREFLLRKRGELDALPLPFPGAVLEEYVLRGGKRLRGALVTLAGGTLDASIGIELFHAYLLIHDDFMDRDELRRGGPTVHVALGGDHRAGSLAILLGSLCQSWAYELVLGAPHGDEAGRALTRALQEVTVGQALDLLAAGAEVPAAGVLAIERLKTGSYSFELPLRIGAIVAGRDPAAYLGYARPLGQAFQIADDLLGTFGTVEATGKPNASDLREGKRTLLVARALEAASPSDAAALRAGLRRGSALTDTEADALRAILRRSGAVDAARAEAERLCAEAIAALDRVPPETAAALREIAEFSLRRAL